MKLKKSKKIIFKKQIQKNIVTHRLFQHERPCYRFRKNEFQWKPHFVIETNMICFKLLSPFQQNSLRQKKSLKRDLSLSLFSSNPWTPLHLFSMWPSSRAGVCHEVLLHSFVIIIYHLFLIMWLGRLFIQVCWAAWRLCLRLWRLSHGGGRFSYKQ